METTFPVPDNAWEIFFLGQTIFLDDQYGYLLQSYDEIQLIDYENPFDPQVIATFELQGRFQQVWAREKLLFLYLIPDNSYLTVVVIDFFQPGGPSARTLPLGDPVEVAVGNNKAFVSVAFGELQIFDLSDPSSVKLIGSFAESGYNFTRIAVRDNYIFLVWRDLQVLALDVHDPSMPAEVDSYSPFGG